MSTESKVTKTRVKITLPDWTNSNSPCYDCAYTQQAFLLSKLTINYHYSEFLTMDKLFALASEINNTKEGETKLNLNGIRVLFESVDPKLICWHLYHTIHHYEVQKHKLNRDRLAGMITTKPDKKSKEVPADPKPSDHRYEVWWAIVHFFHLHSADHQELQSKYFSDIHTKGNTRKLYKVYQNAYSRQKLDTIESRQTSDYWSKLLTKLDELSSGKKYT